MRSFSRLVGCLLVWLCFLVVRPHDAHALEVAGTASLGGFVAGPTPRSFAVRPEDRPRADIEHTHSQRCSSEPGSCPVWVQRRALGERTE